MKSTSRILWIAFFLLVIGTALSLATALLPFGIPPLSVSIFWFPLFWWLLITIWASRTIAKQKAGTALATRCASCNHPRLPDQTFSSEGVCPACMEKNLRSDITKRLTFVQSVARNPNAPLSLVEEALVEIDRLELLRMDAPFFTSHTGEYDRVLLERRASLTKDA